MFKHCYFTHFNIYFELRFCNIIQALRSDYRLTATDLEAQLLVMMGMSRG